MAPFTTDGHRPAGRAAPLAWRLGPDPVRKVAVVRALPGLGDLLCLVPALRALRQALPHAEVTLVGIPQARWMLDRFPAYLDRFAEFPGFPGVPERPDDGGELPTFLSWARDEGFDLAIQAHGSGLVTNSFVALLGARMVACHALPGLPRPDPERARDWVGHEPEPLRYVRLLEHLGIPPAGENLEFPVTDIDRAAAARLLTGGPLPGTYACLHPGSSLASRRWPAARFAEVGDALVDEGLAVVVTGGAAEVELAERVAATMRRPCTVLAGRTDLGPLAAVLEASCLLVCNDTGVSHLAAALRVPSVVVFRSSDPDRWAPTDRSVHRIVGLDEPGVVESRSLPRWHCCLGEDCSLGHRAGARVAPAAVEAAEVLAQARALLAPEPPPEIDLRPHGGGREGVAREHGHPSAARARP